MDTYIKNFIETNIDLIEDRKFKELYRKMVDEGRFRSLGEFTETLLSAGIDPAEGLKILPLGYLVNSSIKYYAVPETVTQLGSYVFANNTELTEVSLPSKLTSIGSAAFSRCFNLSSIILPESLIEIKDQAFYNCRHLKTIKYLGTIAQWELIQKEGVAIFTHTRTIQCKDGNIDIPRK